MQKLTLSDNLKRQSRPESTYIPPESPILANSNGFHDKAQF